MMGRIMGAGAVSPDIFLANRLNVEWRGGGGVVSIRSQGRFAKVGGQGGNPC